MIYETRSTLEGAGDGDDSMPLPTQSYSTPPSDISREQNVDAGRMGASSVEKEERGSFAIVKGQSIGAEKRTQGWTKYTVPSGGIPRAEETVGTRGAADAGRM